MLYVYYTHNLNQGWSPHVQWCWFDLHVLFIHYVCEVGGGEVGFKWEREGEIVRNLLFFLIWCLLKFITQRYNKLIALSAYSAFLVLTSGKNTSKNLNLTIRKIENLFFQYVITTLSYMIRTRKMRWKERGECYRRSTPRERSYWGRPPSPRGTKRTSTRTWTVWTSGLSRSV